MQFLLNRLESLVATGKTLPLTRSVVVDRDAMLELIDSLKAAIPEEVQAARRINAEGERIIETATAEAGRIVSRSQEQAAYLIGERGLTEAAEAESGRIVGEAQAEAESVRKGADEYAVQLLLSLESEVVRALGGIKKGIAVLDERRAALREATGGDPAEAAATSPYADDHEDGDGSEAEDRDADREADEPDRQPRRPRRR